MYVQINKASIIIGAVILAVVFVAGIYTGKQLYDNRGSAADARAIIQDAQQSAAGAADSLDAAASAVNDAQGTADSISDSADRLQESIDADADAIRSGQQVLTDVRGQSAGN